MKEIKIISSEENKRLDLFISNQLNDVSRTYIQKLILDGNILVNNEIQKPKTLVKLGDIIDIKIPKKEEISVIGQKIDLDIVYEDEYLIVVNKPQGMVVHPAPGSLDNTLVNALINYTNELSNINPQRRGIVHRLDKDTSGLIICAKTDEVHLKLVDMFSQRKIKKNYYALCYGLFNNNHGFIDAPIGRSNNDRKKMIVTNKNSKNALTEFKVIKYLNNLSLLDINLHTGRTHQIRVHLKYINHPIVGDEKYGIKNEKVNIKGQLLHAYKLEFNHPITDQNIILTRKVPKLFKDFIIKKGFNLEI